MSLIGGRAPVLPLGALPRVDLLPPSEMRRRDMLARARTWVYIGIGALLVAVVTVGGAFAYNMAAALRLGLEQASTQRILSGIAELADVSAATSLRAELAATGDQAMAGDLAWGDVLGIVEKRLPVGVIITDYALAAGAIPEPAVAPADAPGVMGTVTVSSATPLAFVDFTRMLRKVDAVQVTEVDELTSEEESLVYEYRIHLTVDQSVYSRTPAAAESE